MATPEDARRANRSLLLRTLHRNGPVSRAGLAKVTGLTRATVSAVVRDLMDDEVVEELGLSTAGGVGKPATLVDVAADGRHVLCLDLSEPARFVGAVVDLAGKVVVRRTYDRKDRTGRSAVTLVRRIGRELVADAERPLLGIGVASPGIVDADGVVVTAAHLGWTGVPLGAELAAEFGLPVAVVNDANAAALAELTFGAEPARNLICVRVDEGVGAGLVLDGRLFTGSTYAAGEIGHVVVAPDGDVCACGKRGCLETEVSAPLLAGRLQADAGDGTAVLQRAGEHLGTALATVLSALDVADVVLSGSGAVATDTFRAAAADAIAARAMPLLGDRLVVRAATFGFDDVLVGAAARVLDLELGIR
jgi:predicted NBD/HSP70 family sugar kinase